MPDVTDLTFRTDDETRWGFGKGSDLVPSEVDINFWNLILRIIALEDNPPSPVEISNIQVVGTQLRVFLADGTTYGPFQIPVAAFRWKGEWTAATLYSELDLFFVAGKGLYLVLHDHESASAFDPAEEISEGPLYILIFGVLTTYDIGFYFPATPGAGIESGKAMFAFRADRQFWLPAGLPGTQFGLEVATTVDLTFSIRKNADEIGVATIVSGETNATFEFDSDVQFEVGDRLRVIRPALDDTAEELTATFAARRGTP